MDLRLSVNKKKVKPCCKSKASLQLGANKKGRSQLRAEGRLATEATTTIVLDASYGWACNWGENKLQAWLRVEGGVATGMTNTLYA